MGEPVFLVDANPTVEHIAKIIFDFARSQGLPVESVKVWETPTSWRRPTTATSRTPESVPCSLSSISTAPSWTRSTTWPRPRRTSPSATAARASTTRPCAGWSARERRCSSSACWPRAGHAGAASGRAQGVPRPVRRAHVRHHAGVSRHGGHAARARRRARDGAADEQARGCGTQGAGPLRPRRILLAPGLRRRRVRAEAGPGRPALADEAAPARRRSGPSWWATRKWTWRPPGPPASASAWPATASASSASIPPRWPATSGTSISPGTSSASCSSRGQTGPICLAR